MTIKYAPFDFGTCWRNLGTEQKKSVAIRASTSARYIQQEIASGRVIPRPAKAEALAAGLRQYGIRVVGQQIVLWSYEQSLNREAERKTDG